MNASEDVPEHCPGTESELAGKASSCKGCPNQSICSSNPKSDDTELVKQRLQTIKRKILVLSGKGGVGKSTVTCMLSRALARQGKNVSVLDIDICGPSTPRVLGVEGEQVHQSGSGWSPVFVDDNLSVMSVGFLLKSLDDAVIWRGSKKTGLIKQFLSEVDWGNLDYLIVDTPPGTSDEHLSITSLLSDSLSGVVIVTSPQEISLLDVRKEVNFCKKLNIPIIGVVENMGKFVCPKCSTSSMVFPSTTGGAESMAREMNLPFLAQIPLDSELTRACDEGKDIYEINHKAASAMAFDNLAKDIDSRLVD